MYQHSQQGAREERHGGAKGREHVTATQYEQPPFSTR